MGLFIILLVLLIISAIISLPGVVVVKLGTRFIGRFYTSFHTAYTAVVSSYILYFIIVVTLKMFMKINLSIWTMLGIMFLIHAWTYFRRVRGDEGKVLSIPASLLIALLQVLITGLIIVLFINIPCGISFPAGST